MQLTPQCEKSRKVPNGSRAGLLEVGPVFSTESGLPHSVEGDCGWKEAFERSDSVGSELAAAQDKGKSVIHFQRDLS